MRPAGRRLLTTGIKRRIKEKRMLATAFLACPFQEGRQLKNLLQYEINTDFSCKIV